MSDPDVLLLDDPLAAVDPRVRDLLFDAVKGMKGKTRVLVTHHSGYASYADKVLVLEEGGRAMAYGKPEEVRACEVLHVNSLPPFVMSTATNSTPVSDVTTLPFCFSLCSSQCKEHFEYVKGGWKPLPPPPPPSVAESDKRINSPAQEGIVKKETSNVGRVTFKTYSTYVRAGGIWALPVVILLMSLGQAGIVMSDYTLLEWVESRSSAKLTAFACLAVATVVLAFSRATVFFLAALRASSGLHSRMLDSVVKAPMSWFHSNPEGRVLNRFSADQGQVGSGEERKARQGMSSEATKG